MRRTSLVFALIALAASLFVSGSAFAHGGMAHGHGAHHAARAHETIALPGPIAAALHDAGELAGHMHHSGGTECPGTGMDCCSTHCCAPAGLRVEPGNVSPARVSAPCVISSEGPPPDAAREALFRPPCR